MVKIRDYFTLPVLALIIFSRETQKDVYEQPTQKDIFINT